MLKKLLRLVVRRTWLVFLAVTYACSPAWEAPCSEPPPIAKPYVLELSGDSPQLVEQPVKADEPELVLSGSDTTEMPLNKLSQAVGNSDETEGRPDDFSDNSSRKTKLESPARARGDLRPEPSTDSAANSSPRAVVGRTPTALPLNSKSRLLGPGLRTGGKDQQTRDSGECPGGADENKPLELRPDDVPLTQEEHPFDAPIARSERKDTLRIPAKVTSSRFLPSEIELRRRINDCLSYYMRHPESVVRRSPWAVMHAALPFGAETELVAGNRKVSAIGWMCYNGVCKTQRLFQPTTTGFRTNIGPGVQGHEGQLLAILAQSQISPDYPIRIGDKRYKIADLVRYEMATCRENSELTFKLIGLSYYLHPLQRWRDNQGTSWNLEKMLAEELEQPVIGAACGGTHRLMGISYSLVQRQRAKLPITGHWERAAIYVDEFVDYAISLQNPDGSFSTEWFEHRANDPNLEKKVQTTGHILEWLIFTVSQEELQSQPIQNAVNFLLEQISDNREHDWPIGPRGHSLRALALYNQRVFGASPGELRSFLATLPVQTTSR